MTTVGDLIDRCYRDYLEPSDDQAVVATTTAAYDATATEIAYDNATFAPDEEDLLAPGVLVEIGLEQARVTDVDPDAGFMTVLRGVNGTTAAPIASGDEIRVAPLYSRRSVFDAVCDNIVGLYPDLSRVSMATITSATAAVDIPPEVVAIREARVVGSGRPYGVNAELLRNYTPSVTGQSVLLSGVNPGVAVHLVYEARFDRPELEADEVNDAFGVDPTWERIVVVGAAAQLVAGRDLEPLSQEYIVEQMEQEGLPVGSAQRVRNGLMQLHQAWLTQARRNFRSDRMTPTVVYR